MNFLELKDSCTIYRTDYVQVKSYKVHYSSKSAQQNYPRYSSQSVRNRNINQQKLSQRKPALLKSTNIRVYQTYSWENGKIKVDKRHASNYTLATDIKARIGHRKWKENREGNESTCKKMLESRGIFSLAWILKALESPPYRREVSIGAESRTENERGDRVELQWNRIPKPYKPQPAMAPPPVTESPLNPSSEHEILSFTQSCFEVF